MADSERPTENSVPTPAAERARLRVAGRLRRLRHEFRTRQDELVETQQRLARSERAAALGMLVGQIAHELGTPLHSIAGHLHLALADPELPESIRDRLQIVSGEVSRLSHLIKGQLAALRTPAPSRERVRVNTLILETLAVMRPLLDAGRVLVDTELDAGGDLPVLCDPGQVQQALINLLQNALDATGEGAQILVRSARTGSKVAISVCDNGEGLDPALAEHVFDARFTNRVSGRGNGFGLSICRAIARNHGGEVMFDSAPGTGTVVTMVIDADRWRDGR